MKRHSQDVQVNIWRNLKEMQIHSRLQNILGRLIVSAQRPKRIVFGKVWASTLICFWKAFTISLKVDWCSKGKYSKRIDKAIKYVLQYETEVFYQRNRRLCSHLLHTRQRDIHSSQARSRTLLPENITERICTSTRLRCEPCKI